MKTTKEINQWRLANTGKRLDLSKADLYKANLRYTNLYGARGLKIELITPLMALLDQPGLMRYYKLVDKNNEGIYNGGLKYEIGKTVEVVNANIDIWKSCGAGINLATFDWCLREWRRGYKILICEFTAKDIAAIPVAGDGKFRVHRCKVVGEKKIPKETRTQ